MFIKTVKVNFRIKTTLLRYAIQQASGRHGIQGMFGHLKIK